MPQPRKYATHAERQAAYRHRHAPQYLAPNAATGGEYHEGYTVGYEEGYAAATQQLEAARAEILRLQARLDVDQASIVCLAVRLSSRDKTREEGAPQ
jgi:hypothetical protein